MSTDTRVRLLTAPHHCTQQDCRHEWQDTEGQPRLLNCRVNEIVCPDCQGTSSLYAILHRCRGCGAELESPSGQTWQELTFPCCGVQEIVPSDELLEPGHASCDPAEHYLVECPDCRRKWVAERKHQRQRVVCRSCRCNFPLLSGQAIHDQRPHTQEKHLHCRNCQTSIPVSVTACPICGLRPPFGS